MPIKEFVKRVIDAEWVARVIEVLDRRSDNRMTELGMLGQAFRVRKNQSGAGRLSGVWAVAGKNLQLRIQDDASLPSR